MTQIDKGKLRQHCTQGEKKVLKKLHKRKKRKQGKQGKQGKKVNNESPKHNRYDGGWAV